MTKKTDIEKRVASAYDGLRPPPGLGDEIASRLTDERARPRRVVPYVIALAAVLLIAVGFAFNRGGGGSGESTLADAGPPPSSVGVRVTADGRVMIKLPALDGKWAQVSLDGLATHLRKSADAHGKFTELRPGVKVSDLKVVIEPDADTPWRHLQWLMTVCAQEKLPKLELRTTKGVKLPIPLPTDLGIGAKRVKRITARVLILLRDNGVVYRCGGKETPDAKAIAKYLKDVMVIGAGSNFEVIGEVKASHRVPAAAVTRVLEHYASAGIGRVQFYGTAVPKPKERGALQLPFPDKWPEKAPRIEEEDVVEDENDVEIEFDDPEIEETEEVEEDDDG